MKLDYQALQNDIIIKGAKSRRGASAQKRLAFPLKESVYADVRGAKNDRRTPFAPSIASIRGSSW